MSGRVRTLTRRAALLGLVGLPRRWAVRSAALAAVFAGAAVLTAGEARVAYPAAAAGLVLAAGGVLWLGRAAGRGLERWTAGSIRSPVVQVALATLVVGWAWLLTHREVWGDYSVVRSW